MRGLRPLLTALLLATPLAVAGDEPAEDAAGFDVAAFAAAASAVATSTTATAAAAGAGAADAGVAAVAALAALAGLVASAASAVAGALAALASGALDLLVGALRLAREHPRETAVAAGSVAGAGALAGLAVWLKRLGVLGFLPLYSRLAPEDVLANAARSGVYEHIRANPGAHPRAIAAAVGIGWGTTVYHLGRLEERGLVSATRRGTMKCYFAAGTTPIAERVGVAALKHPTALAIADFVRANPRASQKDVAGALGLSAALVSWHVGRLEQAGVLAKTRAGKGTALVAIVAG